MAASVGLSAWLAASDPAVRCPTVECPALRRPVALRMFPEPSPERPLPAQVQVLCAPTPRRQGRPAYLMVAAVATLAVIGGLGLLGQAASARIPAETTVVRVGAGETLWDVAQRVAPGSDPRAVVERIRQLNGTPGSAIQPGQQLRVPTGR
ncbi:MAG: LysM peptidoglycan-binding domain-containing protein [Pseudonocardiales bacterium]